jgi:hypothetical protein
VSAGLAVDQSIEERSRDVGRSLQELFEPAFEPAFLGAQPVGLEHPSEMLRAPARLRTFEHVRDGGQVDETKPLGSIDSQLQVGGSTTALRSRSVRARLVTGMPSLTVMSLGVRMRDRWI